MSQQQLTREGPSQNEIQLIGIELAATRDGRETELEMIGIKQTMPYAYYDNIQGRITVHTSNGDITVRFPMTPGQYQAHR